MMTEDETASRKATQVERQNAGARMGLGVTFFAGESRGEAEATKKGKKKKKKMKE